MVQEYFSEAMSSLGKVGVADEKKQELKKVIERLMNRNA
jgi:hypothetical protein